MSEAFKRAYEIVGLGKVGSNSHPVHPATVHFPIAFLTVANALNLLYGTAIYLPFLFPLAVDKQNTGALTIIGYFLNLIGIVASVPAILTGFAELYAMIGARGLYVADQETGDKKLEPVVKIALTHAGLNDVAVIGAVYNWLMERHRPYEDYRPYGHQIILSGGALVMTLYAAYLGGGLIYTHGVGVQRMGAGAEEKKEKTK